MKFTDVGSVDVRVRPEGRGILLEVADTGIGFDEAFRRRLFSRFTQADVSITRRFGGSGLGLSICRALAELMSGSLDASSKPNQGAVFRLSLPLERALPIESVETPHAGPAKMPDEQARTPLILLAEDHPTNRRVVELILQHQPVRLVQVENGAQALEAAFNDTFDLILMDMQMPVMDGLAATRAIRARESSIGQYHTPICMLTANALPEHVRESLAAGADWHLAKPLSAKALLSLVAEVLE